MNRLSECVFFWLLVGTRCERTRIVRIGELCASIEACLHYNKVCNKNAMYMQIGYATNAWHAFVNVCVCVYGCGYLLNLIVLSDCVHRSVARFCTRTRAVNVRALAVAAGMQLAGPRVHDKSGGGSSGRNGRNGAVRGLMISRRS